ncbi:Rab3 GTPase-activating protein catalytic subunit [Oryzias melastigma]|uniref:procollagen-proline 4-dioxygenase n=1 Tax=Oryzias melastigma TaxID=30732 RepID=A0A834FRP6_ORYME|nr:Rab3 GTPase-activating protein catalytic subunit [Oryzias melastigma]
MLLCWFIQLLLFSSPAQSDLFTSIGQMMDLLMVEKDLVSSLKDYISAEEEKLQRLKQWAERLDVLSAASSEDPEGFLGHPVNAFKLVKRLNTEWAELESLVLTDMSDAFISNLTIQRQFFPNDEDQAGAAKALMRLQDTYQLETSIISSGQLPGSEDLPRSVLTVDDCYDLGKVAYSEADYFHTKLWMTQALRQLEQGEASSTQGELLAALDFTKRLLELDPTHQRANGNLKYFEYQLSKKKKAEQIDEEDQNQKGDQANEYLPERRKYEQLCRGQGALMTPRRRSRLFCRYFNNQRHPNYLIGPVKQEDEWDSPYIVRFHDIASEKEMEMVKELAKPRLRRATVHDPQTGKLTTAQYRVSKSAWLGSHEHPVVDKINQRIEDITGLDVSTAEDLQVANYGVGGQYEPHFDFGRKDEPDAFEELGTGNRIATWLLYMSDVQAGGNTVFTDIGAVVRPKKGTAVFWYNLHRSGEGDYRTRHAACPVLIGNKWVSNKWIHERGQEFRRRCSLQPSDDVKNKDHEADVFEITDFTTASEWERFVSRVEEVLNDWKLTESSVERFTPQKGDFTTGSWEEESKEIHFADFKFLITHYFLKKELKNDDEQEKQAEDALPAAMQDLLCMQNDFPPRAHCLVRWYGLQEFVVITPATNSEAIISESKCNLLLSSVSISLSNSGCQVPVFVQIQQKWRRIYAGECQGPGVRTDFEIVHLRRVPSQYNHLSGLLDIFKSKIGCNMLPLPPVDIAIRFTYILQDWQQYSWPQQPPDFDALLGGEVGGVEIGKLPFGACEESISELHLAATWPHVTEGLVVDNDVYSDLDPLQAPHWSVRVRMAENPQCLLGDYLTEFYRLCCRKESVEDVLGKGLTEEEGKDTSDISSALSKLTEPAAPVPISRLSVSSMVHSARKRIHRRRHIHESPLSNEVLNSILLYLFPDAAVEKSDSLKDKAVSLNSRTAEKEWSSDESLFLQLKSAPPDSLTYRLALCVFLVNYSYGGLAGVAHLWQEFVLELRYRWENTCLVYGLEAGPPDLRCCLLHQKLQMLNCCIERRRARDEARKAQEASKDKHSKEAESELSVSASSSAKETSQGKSWESWSDSEDEFYECLSEQGRRDPRQRRDTTERAGRRAGSTPTIT